MQTEKKIPFFLHKTKVRQEFSILLWIVGTCSLCPILWFNLWLYKMSLWNNQQINQKLIFRNISNTFKGHRGYLDNMGHLHVTSLHQFGSISELCKYMVLRAESLTPPPPQFYSNWFKTVCSVYNAMVLQRVWEASF